MVHKLAVVAGLFVLGCWGSSDDDDENVGTPPAPVVSPYATKCTSEDEERTCVTCDGKPEWGSLITLDGNLIWSPAPGAWRFIEQRGELATWCRE